MKDFTDNLIIVALAMNLLTILLIGINNYHLTQGEVLIQYWYFWLISIGLYTIKYYEMSEEGSDYLDRIRFYRSQL